MRAACRHQSRGCQTRRLHRAFAASQNVNKAGVRKLAEDGDLLQALAATQQSASQAQLGTQLILPDHQRVQAFVSAGQYGRLSAEEVREGAACARLLCTPRSETTYSWRFRLQPHKQQTAAVAAEGTSATRLSMAQLLMRIACLALSTQGNAMPRQRQPMNTSLHITQSSSRCNGLACADLLGCAYLGATLRLIGGEDAHELRRVLAASGATCESDAVEQFLSDTPADDDEDAEAKRDDALAALHKLQAVCKHLRMWAQVLYIQERLWSNAGAHPDEHPGGIADQRF